MTSDVAAPADSARPPRLLVRDVRKRFGATVALDGVDLQIEAGEVRALLGENGAGKSTLMGILAGVVRPDAGALFLDGEAFAPDGPRAAHAAGIAMVHQEPSGCPHLTVAENLVLGTEPVRHHLLSAAAMRVDARRALDTLGPIAASLPLDARLLRLTPAEQQLVEIARALRQAAGGRVLILDEPTTALGRPEVERLFEVIGQLSARGTTVLYISHILEELARVATHYTVLRDGRTVAAGAMAGTAPSDIVRAMTGRALDPTARRAARQVDDGDSHGEGEVVLALDRLARSGALNEATLTLHAGEVLGIAGLMGSGRTELLRAIFGLDAVRAGRVLVAGVAPGGLAAELDIGARRGGASPRRRIAEGLGMLSEDRAREGLALGLSLGDNLTLSRPATRGPRWLLSPRRERMAFVRWARRLRIRCRDADQVPTELSGGNQQKLALARLLHQRARVLLLDEPTRGIDVGSKAEIHDLIAELARSGKAVLLVSSEPRELLATCDRIAVMRRGRLEPALPASSYDEATLLLATTGVATGAATTDSGETAR